MGMDPGVSIFSLGSYAPFLIMLTLQATQPFPA